MLKLKEIIRLKDNALSQQQIARSLKISVGAVHKYLHLAQEKGLTWSQASQRQLRCPVERQLRWPLFFKIFLRHRALLL